MSLCTDPTYTGHPEITGLTAISLNPYVSTLRGWAPLCVQVSLLDTGWTGPTVGSPYECLEFTINFGDGGGVQRFTNPTNEATVNPNSDQAGPEAFYVYRTPGSYTITITARGWNGTAFVTASTTTLLQVATVGVRVFSATTGTFTLKVKNADHARSAFFFSSFLPTLSRPAGHAITPGSTGFSYAGWFNLTTTRKALGFTLGSVYGTTNGEKAWKLSTTATSPPTLKLEVGRSSALTPVSVTSPGNEPDTAGWHFVVASCDVAAGTISLFVDGGTATTAAREVLPMLAPSTVQFLLGSTGAEGSLDECAYWDRPLTAPEIAWLYNSGSGRHYDDLAASSPPTGLTTGLKAWWTLDEPHGPSWSDASGNGQSLSCLATNRVVYGVMPKVPRPGTVTETAPIAYNATMETIAQAMATALGVTSTGLRSEGDIYRCGARTIRFGGSLAGGAWTVLPGTLAGGFDGTLETLGGDSGETASAIAVSLWDDTASPPIYVNSSAASGGNGTEATPYNSLASIPVDYKAKRVMLAAGSDFTATGSVYLRAPNARSIIQKWGAGANPIIRLPSGTGLYMQPMYNFAHVGTMLDSVDIQGYGSIVNSTGSVQATTLDSVKGNIHLLNCNVTGMDFMGSRINIANPLYDRVAIYGGSVSGGAAPSYDHAQNVAISVSCFGAIVGASISGGGASQDSARLFAHHTYWTCYGHGQLGRWIRYGQTAVVPSTGQYGYLNFCIKGNCAGDLTNAATGPAQNRRGFVLDSCDLNGTQNAATFSRHNGSETIGNTFDRVVLMRNRIYRTNDMGDQNFGPHIQDSLSITIRDNQFWKNSGVYMVPVDPSVAGYPSIYRNLFSAVGFGYYRGQSITLGAITGAYIHLNTMVRSGTNAAPGGSKVGLWMVNWTTLAATSGVSIDDNRYYYPDQPDSKEFYNTATATIRTLADWQALGYDTRAVVENPGWPDPANGVFAAVRATVIDRLPWSHWTHARSIARPRSGR